MSCNIHWSCSVAVPLQFVYRKANFMSGFSIHRRWQGGGMLGSASISALYLETRCFGYLTLFDSFWWQSETPSVLSFKRFSACFSGNTRSWELARGCCWRKRFYSENATADSEIFGENFDFRYCVSTPNEFIGIRNAKSTGLLENFRPFNITFFQRVATCRRFVSNLMSFVPYFDSLHNRQQESFTWKQFLLMSVSYWAYQRYIILRHLDGWAHWVILIFAKIKPFLLDYRK